jgi:hypothetical protein
MRRADLCIVEVEDWQPAATSHAALSGCGWDVTDNLFE